MHAHHAEDLRVTREIIAEKYADYLPADQVTRWRRGHRFNMFLMRKDVFRSYSAWLFDILFELERRLAISDYSSNDRRVFGFVGERLLDVWLTHDRPSVCECGVVNLESQHWGKKIYHFLETQIQRYLA